MAHRRRIGLASVSILAVTVCLLIWSNSRQHGGEFSTADVSAAVDGDALEHVGDLRVFFAHQSVGANIVDGIAGAYDAAGLASPDVMEVTGQPRADLDLVGSSGGFFAHSYVGVNGDPMGKIDEFDSWLRSGMGDQLDVALLKLCYVDFTAATDVDAVFEHYRVTMAHLTRDYPDIAFVSLTVPLTTEPGLKTKVKALWGGSNTSPADNATRERYNSLLRNEFSDRLFDIATFESTAPDGTRINGSLDGRGYYALYDGYALDEGHLDATTSQVAAARLMSLLADSAP